MEHLLHVASAGVVTLERLVGEGLVELESLTALLAFVLVRGHGTFGGGRSENLDRGNIVVGPHIPDPGPSPAASYTRPMPPWLALAAAYVVGSLDFAVVIGRAHGVDITEVGSGNPGTSNVLRTLGRGPAAMVLVGDALKGVIAAAMGWFAAGGGNPGVEPLAYAAGFAAVLGHCFPLFHRFRGGKGVATAAGALAFLLPQIAFPLAVVWIVLARVTKIAAVASLVVVVAAVPLAFWQGVEGAALAWLGAIIVLIVIRHVPNIRRLVSGAEHQVET